MVARVSIRPAGAHEVPSSLSTLTRAFENDPICNWAWSDRTIYREAFPRFCQAFGGAAFGSGDAHVEGEGGGAALWLAPGAAPDEAAILELVRATAPASRQEPLFSIFEQMDAFHPHEPHWHLTVIGVDPALQGRGIGSELLGYGLARCDEDQALAYLEATSESNRRLYERHGFEAIGVIQAADSPPITPMIRKPRRR